MKLSLNRYRKVKVRLIPDEKNFNRQVRPATAVAVLMLWEKEVQQAGGPFLAFFARGGCLRHSS
jgi:hypothetical protein